MTPGLLPVFVEVVATLAFCGVLVYLRKTLTTKGLIFWILLWVMRGAVSLFAMDFIVSTERLAGLLYAPLQIAFAVALVVIAVRLENQKSELRSLNEELATLRKAAAQQLDFDPTTGLRNRSALARWMEEEREFVGIVVVCDMDDFKQLNDTYGHLVGDEVLHGVGKLIHGSIREEDLAFRWGGDEFVIFFHNSDEQLVGTRMRKIEGRLREFRIRQHGAIPVRFSWGAAPTSGRSLRESLEAADRTMYELKRARRAENATA